MRDTTLSRYIVLRYMWNTRKISGLSGIEGHRGDLMSYYLGYAWGEIQN